MVSELGLLLLAGALALVTWRRRRHLPALARAIVAGTGAVLAYIISETAKVAISQPRPCRSLRPDATIASCPSATDWSLPSNHATIAMALAIALTFVTPRAARWAVPVAVVIAISRVALGVHYPHDVATGMVLAAAVVTLSALVLERPFRTVLSRLGEWSGVN